MKNKKEQLIKQHLESPIQSGDLIEVKGLGSRNPNLWGSVKAVRVEEDGVIIKNYGREDKIPFENVRKSILHIGADPFEDDLWRKVQNVNFTLESVLFKLGITDKTHRDEYTTDRGFKTKACNFNPFVIINGEKKYYQRPFVWTLEEMQSLIHSIYNRVACGKIVVRERGFKWVMESQREEDECCWADIVDGKQRLTTLQKFLNNEFSDRFGNFWDDLSKSAQHKFLDHQLFSYCEMGEDVTDEDVLKQFLSINFTGIPQSKEHIEYVESLIKR